MKVGLVTLFEARNFKNVKTDDMDFFILNVLVF